MDVLTISAENKTLEIYRFIFDPVKTNMYIFLSNTEAVIIDPHISKEGYECLLDNEICNIKILLTHEHYDHTSGVTWYRDRFKSELICHSKCAEKIMNASNNRPLLVALVLSDKDKKDGENKTNELLINYKPYTCKADIIFENEMFFDFNEHNFYFKHTPGHSMGSCCISLDECVVFTGDSLIKDTPVITRFPGGSLKDYNEKTIPYFKSLKDEMFIMSGHGEFFLLSEVNYLK